MAKVETIRMHGEAFDGTGAIVNRDVPLADVPAFKAAGYTEGYLYTEEDAKAQTGLIDDYPESKPVTRSKKRSK